MYRFKKFYTDNGDKLFGYLLRKTGNTYLAADLAQETFTRYLEQYRNGEQSVALLFTIGRNLFYDHVRQQPRGELKPDELDGNLLSQPEESYSAKQKTSKIIKAMQQLGDEERDILSLIVSSSMRYEEIAALRKCTVANVKVMVHRARKKLKKLLQEDCHE
jgi:RNA polymerase sigma-70 factor (ECF subfamily)